VVINHPPILRKTFILLVIFNSRRRYFSLNQLFRKYGTADELRYTQTRNPFAAHESSIKRRPNFALFAGFAVKIIHIFLRHLFILLTLFNFRRRYFSIYKLFRKYGTADERRYTQMRNPFAAHESRIKRPPSFALFACFAVINHPPILRKTFILLIIFNYWRRYFSIYKRFRK
jgi:steroid 5-alpha reductase family enzyme